MLKVWVAFLVLLFFFLLFYLGLYLKSGHYNLSAGRPLLVIQLSRDNKNKWANDFFFLPYFCGDYFFYFSTTETSRFIADRHGLCLDCTVQRRMLEIETGKLLLEITYLMSVDYLLLSWMWNYNLTLDTITYRLGEQSYTHELNFPLTQLRFRLHAVSSACKGDWQQTWTSMCFKTVTKVLHPGSEYSATTNKNLDYQ